MKSLKKKAIKESHLQSPSRESGARSPSKENQGRKGFDRVLQGKEKTRPSARVSEAIFGEKKGGENLEPSLRIAQKRLPHAG